MQAVDNATSKVAKHGYTVKNSAYRGVCWGSGNLPLELSTRVAVSTIEEMDKIAVDAYAHAARIRAGEVEIQFVKRHGVWDQATGQYKRLPATREELQPFEVHQQMELAAAQSLSHAKAHEAHARMLTKLIDQRHGQPLYAVEMIERGAA